MSAEGEPWHRLPLPFRSALLSPSGRVPAAEPHGLLPTRVDVTGGNVLLADGREAVLEQLGEGYLLRVPRPGTRRPVLSPRFLGGMKCSLDGRALPLSLRHAELLTALALHPRG